MPHYFLDTYDGSRLLADETGMELGKLGVAEAEVQKALNERTPSSERSRQVPAVNGNAISHSHRALSVEVSA
jgi:ribosomal protein L11